MSSAGADAIFTNGFFATDDGPLHRSPPPAVERLRFDLETLITGDIDLRRNAWRRWERMIACSFAPRCNAAANAGLAGSA